MSTPLLSVGIPVYNGMPFLPEAINSIIGQTYSRFELVVVDDGSTDDSLRYLQTIRDPRVRVLTQNNRGITATLNRILDEARAPWLVRLDADDVSRSERLAITARAIDSHPCAGMFYSRAVHYGHAGAIGAVRVTEGSASQLRQSTRNGHLLSIVHVSTALNVAKTKALGGYRFNLHVEDLDLWWRMALNQDIVFLPEVTVEIRLNAGSTCITNIEKLSVNTIFAQYLLLSHLRGAVPLPYDQVVDVLTSMVDQRRLKYRAHMWRAGSHLAKKEYAFATSQLVHAASHSPRHLFSRAMHAMAPNRAHLVGEDPARFEKLADRLWPSTG